MLIADAYTLQQLLTDMGSVFTAMIGYVGDICSAIVAQPLLLIGVAIPLAFAVVTFVKDYSTLVS